MAISKDRRQECTYVQRQQPSREKIRWWGAGMSIVKIETRGHKRAAGGAWPRGLEAHNVEAQGRGKGRHKA
ncbi:hypothetical protein L484_013071 [Morus notabilis]|uniref:Uncharacterized protein n=1 Tax=Morus notabilis TaxID=981085 RepID=W9QZ69_9ROSA|nr:hypothetical protein L484_013071 [Morus notabilis]